MAENQDQQDLIKLLADEARERKKLSEESKKAAEAANAGAAMEEIVSLVEDLRSRTRIIATLDTLENLKKGGRIGGAAAMLGTIVQIKPCLDLSSGEVVEAGRQRTRKKACQWLRDELSKAGDVEAVTIIHGDAPDAQEIHASLADIVPIDQIRIGQLGAVIGTHGGPRVLGLTFLVK